MARLLNEAARDEPESNAVKNLIPTAGIELGYRSASTTDWAVELMICDPEIAIAFSGNTLVMIGIGAAGATDDTTASRSATEMVRPYCRPTAN